MTKSVFLDTNILIWGVKKQASKGQEDMIEKASALLNQLRDSNSIVSVSAIVLAEACANLSSQQASRFAETLKQYFEIVPFDYSASLVYSKLFEQKYRTIASSISDRKRLKIDFMVVASAVSRGISIIYSEDPHMKNLTLPNIQISGIPCMVVQRNLSIE